MKMQNNPWVKDFPILAADENGNRLVYLDSAATTQHPTQVLDAVTNYYKKDNANPHRGVYELAMRATDAHEGARHRVAQFFGAQDDEIVFTQNTTEGLNLVAYSYGMHFLHAGDEIVISVAEHHSNLVPWQRVAQATGAKVEQVRVELGGSVSACGTRAVLDHAKAEYDLDAVYFGSREAVLDYNDVSVHTAKDTLCEMHTAGVLTGSASKILRGTIDFRRGAKRGVGHESEDVLLFSPTARNRTAPLILCGEEEVEGQHAASIGRLDEEKLYYLRSRGLSETQARRLMVDARFAPAMDKIPLDALREEVRAEAARRLDEDAE